MKSVANLMKLGVVMMLFALLISVLDDYHFLSLYHNQFGGSAVFDLCFLAVKSLLFYGLGTLLVFVFNKNLLVSKMNLLLKGMIASVLICSLLYLITFLYYPSLPILFKMYNVFSIIYLALPVLIVKDKIGFKSGFRNEE